MTDVTYPPRMRKIKHLEIGNFKWLFCFLCLMAVSTSLWALYNSEFRVVFVAVKNDSLARVAIKPLTNKSTEIRNVTKPLTKKPIEIQPCPELKDIPNLIQKRTMNLSEEIQMSHTEKILLGKELANIQQAINKSKALIHGRARFNSSGKNYMENLSPFGQTVGNYRWFPGGLWQPANCKARWKVAIIIPYRDRAHHVPIMLRYLVPMLQKQMLSFAFFIINQGNSLLFNRATLLNVGYIESLKFDEWDCFILHDVDHVPLSELNNYGCENMPRRVISGSDRWQYRMPYYGFFGAVTGLTKANIQQINGFPNVYWGWGGEDDDILQRLRTANIKIHFSRGKLGYFNVIQHHHGSAPKQAKRYELLKEAGKRLKSDGLNNLQYKLQNFKLNALYTNISVDIWEL